MVTGNVTESLDSFPWQQAAITRDTTDSSLCEGLLHGMVESKLSSWLIFILGSVVMRCDCRADIWGLLRRRESRRQSVPLHQGRKLFARLYRGTLFYDSDRNSSGDRERQIGHWCWEIGTHTQTCTCTHTDREALTFATK